MWEYNNNYNNSTNMNGQQKLKFQAEPPREMNLILLSHARYKNLENANTIYLAVSEDKILRAIVQLRSPRLLQMGLIHLDLCRL